MSEIIARWSQQPEGQYFERKSAFDRLADGRRTPRSARAIAKDVVETLAAMANADGGELVIGIENDGGITGVPHPEDKVTLITDAPSHAQHVRPPLRVKVTSVRTGDDMVLLHFDVDWSPVPHQLADGRYLRRFRDENRPWPADDLTAIKQTERERQAEGGHVAAATLDDLDVALLDAFRQAVGLGLSDRELLLKYRLAEPRNGTVVLTMAALLLFGREPDRWHPRCGIDFVKYEGTQRGVGGKFNVVRRERIEAPLPRLIDQAHAAIAPHVRQRQRLVDLFFEERLEYPTFAWQEAVVNAVAHRDYAMTGVGIEVAMFDDRLEVRSPGGLIAPVTLDRLRRREQVHASRNPHVVRVLTDWGYMRELGEGIPRIYAEMEEAWLRAPEFNIVADSLFDVVLHNTPVLDDDARAWLKRFPAADLTPNQLRLLVYAREHDGRFTSHAYQRLVGTDIASAQRDIRGLLRKGLVRQLAKGGRVYALTDRRGPEVPPEDLAPLLPLLTAQGFLTNGDVRDGLSLSRIQAKRRLDRWVDAGWLVRTGQKRGTRYVPGPSVGTYEAPT